MSKTPARSGYGYKRRRYGRRYGTRKYVTAQQVVKIAKAEVKREEKKELELKIADKAAGPTNITWAGTMVNLSNYISQGTGGFDNRVGDNINLKSLLMRWQVARSDNENSFRIVVFRWMSDSTPTAQSIFDTTGSLLSCLSPLEKDTAHSVQVLYDELVVVSTYTNARQVGKFYRKLGGKAQWTTGGTSGKGHVYMALVSDNGVTGVPFNYWCRIRFTDA